MHRHKEYETAAEIKSSITCILKKKYVGIRLKSAHDIQQREKKIRIYREMNNSMKTDMKLRLLINTNRKKKKIYSPYSGLIEKGIYIYTNTHQTVSYSRKTAKKLGNSQGVIIP